MTDPTHIITLAQTLAETAHAEANREVASAILEARIPADLEAKNCDVLLAIAAMIAAEGAQAADHNEVPRGVAISIIAGAVSILAQQIGEAMLEVPPPNSTIN